MLDAAAIGSFRDYLLLRVPWRTGRRDVLTKQNTGFVGRPMPYGIARAASFVHEWKDAKYERGGAQTIWNEFFSIVGITRRRLAVFEKHIELLGGASLKMCFRQADKTEDGQGYQSRS